MHSRLPLLGALATSLLLLVACESQRLPFIDYSCAAPADCVEKNVGSCCGDHIRCVNADFEPDLDAVDAFCGDQRVVECAESLEVTSCRCIDNSCRTMHGDEEI